MRLFTLLAATALLTSCVADVPRRQAPVAATFPTRPAVGAARLAPLLERIAHAAPEADPAVLRLALQARTCAIDRGAASADSRLAVIDYSLPSTQRRLWVFDLQAARLLFNEFVAHGRGSGDNVASRFSNTEGSLESSLGLFSTAETYIGDNGYSLRMDGLEPGVNDNARSRALVIHGAWYVDPLLALKQGRLGRSLGCPALRPAVANQVIDSIKMGQLIFAYYPDHAWLAHSPFLDCGHALATASTASLHAVSH